MKGAHKVGIGLGFLIAGLVAAALLGVLFFAWRVVGLPFVPFDAFDWMTRTLPGRLIAFGISTMVTVIRALNVGPTATAAKTAEQAMAILGLFGSAVVVGVILFVAARAVGRRYAILLGALFGLMFGFPLALVSYHASRTATVAPWVGAVWILSAFLVWGMVLGWARRRLSRETSPAETVASAEEGQVSAERLDRRRFLVRLGGSAAVITVAGAVVGELAEVRRREMMMAMAGRRPWSSTHPLPNADAAVKPAPGTRPELTPLERHYRIDINTISPAIDGQRWKLKVNGWVEKPLELSLEQLRRFEPMHQFITLSCISNPVGGDLIGTTRWTGVSLRRLLPLLGLKPGATHLKIRAADEFFEVVSLEMVRADERIMLAYEWDGEPLTREHGFPLRIYVPDVHGMKQPKWIESIEAIGHWEPGYWVKRGWDKVARMKATAVIDAVAVDMTLIGGEAAGKVVPIGGIAHAGARGISKVEVQVDDGPWQQAALRTPVSVLTWVVWRYDWPFQHGKHTFTVRCVDGKGAAQITEPAPPEPGGASGLHSKTQML